MKLATKSQQLMIEDGLPQSLILDQSERNKAWENSPPRKPVPYFEKRVAMTQEEINLLFELKASKERGAASLGCNAHLTAIAYLEKAGFAKQHGYGPTAFFITDAGLDELKNHKKPEPKPVKPQPVITKEIVKGLGWKSAPKTGTGHREPKAPNVARAKAIDPNLSALCKECGVTSKNRSAALDFLNTKIGKQQTVAATMKAVYGKDDASEGALDTVIRALQRDVGNSKAKYEIKRIKDSKGVYSYGLYKS